MDELARQCSVTVCSWWLHSAVVERAPEWVDVAVWTRWSKLTIGFRGVGFDEEESRREAEAIYFEAACELLQEHRKQGKPGVPALPTGCVNIEEAQSWTAEALADPIGRPGRGSGPTLPWEYSDVGMPDCPPF